ncbi:TIGR04222 domain-containing membrane protein [Xanthomonas translucens]|uniref:TIGR04222 domain-containing membrane protein n=2 Tax=Xanthomonas campestris pv. translucens TaxID=343 RepID=A0A109HKN6_XANCT|nr:TIGR04222 domain-containing membrane protein [Xanthomonas translucens]KWV13992.1 hypothetical protein ATB53_14655 [Xanthomonas translucens]QSQ33049.1 TIGR04222 domain-containing membrane protein [Xanthomonas translucens pv. translucens]
MTTATGSSLLRYADDPQRALWERLQAYRFGEDDAALPAFVRRVAKEVDIPPALAAQAVEEYRRFCFLACTAQEQATPSPLLDQVWHTHLTDTREYWQRFCPQVLRITLHHQPGRGDAADAVRHREQYRATLERYWRHFGEPPASCWPPAMAAHAQVYTVGPRERCWRMPREGGKAVWIWALITLLLGMCLAPFNDAASPLHWRGGSFLLLFFASIGLACTAAARVRRMVRGIGQHRALMQVDSAELAYLAGGSERVAEMQLGLLLSCGAVRLHAPRRTRRRASADLQDTGVEAPASLQRALLLVRANPQLTRALQALRDDARPLRDALIGKRLWLGRGQAWCARLAGAAPLLMLWLVGLRKIQIGLQLQRPVGFLVAAMVVVTLVALGFLLTPPRRNLAGERLLAERDAALLTDAGPRHTAQALDLAQPLALAGTGMLLGTPWADYHSLRAPIASGSGGSGCSSSGCGGGGGGGGGGGCSSGCGGCGGGS